MFSLATWSHRSRTSPEHFCPLQKACIDSFPCCSLPNGCSATPRYCRSNNPSSKQLDATKEQYASAFNVAQILAGDGTEKPTGPEDLANPNADIFPTSNGHKKVVTETTKPPLEDDEDPDLGLRSIDVVARVVQKDMWQEESKALERRALEAGNRSSRVRNRWILEQ